MVSTRLRPGHRPQPASQPLHLRQRRISTEERGDDAAYLDRSRAVPGLLHGADPTVHVFTDRGWRWGGYWTTPIDYQHFERP